MPTIHLLIKGKVQGVFYRASAKEQADRLSLKGWVRNTPEGHVEIVVSGEDPVLQKFITWCRQGPPHAVVTEVISSAQPEKRFEGFLITRG